MFSYQPPFCQSPSRAAILCPDLGPLTEQTVPMSLMWTNLIWFWHWGAPASPASGRIWVKWERSISKMPEDVCVGIQDKWGSCLGCFAPRYHTKLEYKFWFGSPIRQMRMHDACHKKIQINMVLRCVNETEPWDKIYTHVNCWFCVIY